MPPLHSMQRLVAACALLACLSLSTGAAADKSVGPSWYKCDPKECLPSKNCQCPTVTPPGGLKPEETPQFVVITHDDAVNALSNKVVRSVTDGHKNPNGCNVPATWFVLEAGSDCKLSKQLWKDNHEIASHTLSHYQMYARLARKVNFTKEIVGARDWLVNECGIPKEDVVGFRAPYLVHNAEIRRVLYRHDFLYDSSINEVFPSETSPNKNSRLWPYTMDRGIPQNCAWTAPDGNCTRNERYPGLWEFPLWDLQNAKGDSISTMDPTGDVYKLLVDNFNFNYQGNRAPLGIFVHAPWFNSETKAAANKFIEWALERPDVWFVTMRQVIEWMKNPVPASKMGDWLKCNKVDLKPPEVKYCQLYTVQPGDYLWLIATTYGVSPAEVLQLNPSLGDGTRLSVGSKIKLPPWRADCGDGKPVNGDPPGTSQQGGTPSPSSPGASKGPAPSPSSVAGGRSPAAVRPPLPPPSPPPPPPPSCRTWRVKTGDFLFAIAQSTGADVAELISLNKLRENAAIMPGQVLMIPPYPACCNTTERCPDAVPLSPPPASPQPPKPSSRLTASLVLTGVTRTAWETDLKLVFRVALARLLGVDTAAVTVTSVRTMDRPAAGPAAAPAALAPAEAPAAPAVEPTEGAADPSPAPTAAEASSPAPAAAAEPAPGPGPASAAAPRPSRRLLTEQGQQEGSPAPTPAPLEAAPEPAPATGNAGSVDGEVTSPDVAEEEEGGVAPPPSLGVEVSVSSNTPLELYRTAMEALETGKMGQALSALGMTLVEDPKFKAVLAKN